MTGEIRSIVRKGGISALFRGLPATIVRDMPFSGIYLYIYEGILKPTDLPNAVGAILSGMFSTLITHPADVIKTRQMIGGTKLVRCARRKTYGRHEVLRFLRWGGDEADPATSDCRDHVDCL